MKLNSNRWKNVDRIAAHEVTRPRFVARNPYQEGVGDFERQPIWDFYGVAAATATILQRLFTVAQGNNHTLGGLNILKTAWLTSMVQSGLLPNPNRILVRRVALYLLNRMNPTDVTRFLDETIVSLVIGTKTYLQILAAKLPAGGGAWAGGAANALGAMGNGAPCSDNGFNLIQNPGSGPISGSGYPAVDGIEICQGQNFRVDVDPTQCTPFNAAGVGFTTAAAAAQPAGIGVLGLIHLDGTQLTQVQ